MNDDYYQLVEQKQKEFADLWGRMDEDKKLLILDDYVMRDKDNREEPDVDNITMNDAGVFADKVHNTLIRAEVIPEVEGNKLKDEDADIIELFIRDIGLEADGIIQKQDYPSFKEWEILQACDRGRVARRITLALGNDGKLAPTSFLPIDSHYLIYDVGVDGLRWVATRLPRGKEDIEDEYPNAGVKRSTAIVTDFWNNELECIYVNREKVAENENVWGEPPFVIQVMPTGVMTMDADRMLMSGESIFARNRDLYAAKNMFATILNSGVVRSFFNGLQIEVENVALAKKPQMPPYGKKFVVPVGKGTQGYFNMPIADLTNTARMFYSILDSALQEGAFPKISYGTLQFPVSAVGMAELKEAEDPVYFPRIQGLAIFWQRCYRMIINQYKQLKLNIAIGEEGFRKEYNYKDLDKEYAIKFRFFVTSPKQDMVNISTAAAVGNLVSDDTKRREYLHLQNPTLENTKMLAERAARMSPAVAMYDIIKALFDQGEKLKANLMAEEMGMTLDQLLSGGVPSKAATAEEKPPTQLMPLLRGTGGGGGRMPQGTEGPSEEEQGAEVQ